MFPFSGVELLFLALAISIVIKPITRAATDIARARHQERDKTADGDSRARIEALEERLRLMEERQDFTDRLLLGRRETRLGGPGAPAPPDGDPPHEA